MDSDKYVSELHFFMTLGLSLASWQKANIITRELNYFKSLVAARPSIQIYIYTYNSNLEHEYKILRKYLQTKKIQLIEIKKYAWFQNARKLILRFRTNERKIIRTNQTPGAIYALFFSFFAKRSLFVYRTGYSVSDFKKREQKVLGYIYYKFVELLCGYFCDIRITTSLDQSDKNILFKKVNIFEVPNYIPDYMIRDDSKHRSGFVYYGRLSKQKQIYDICLSFAETPHLSLDIYGNGDEEQKLKQAFSNYKNINFYDAVPNNKLPEVMSRYRFGMLLSEYEGMPKVAIEMQAMGLVLVATPVGNLAEILKHDENAILAPIEKSLWSKLFIKLNTYPDNKLETIQNNGFENIKQFTVENAISKELRVWENTY